VRFDVMQAEDDPSEVWLYEMYRDRAAVDDHVNTERFKRVVATIEDWFGEPEQVRLCTPALLTEETRGGG
jgi:autoinducer 2-degrading protein